MNVLSLFNGISSGYVALEQAGVSIMDYYSSEICQKAMMVTKENNLRVIEIGDIKEISFNSFRHVNLIIGGPECQSYSMAGKRTAEDLWQFELVKKAIDIIKPKYYLIENVPCKKEILNKINAIMGHGPHIINSNLFVPQNRLRYYWTNIPIPELPNKPTDKTLYDTCEDKDSIPICFSSSGRGKNGVERRLSDNKRSHTLTRTGFSNRSFSGFITKKREIRDFTQVELERLMGLSEGYTSCLPLPEAKKVIGNGWAIDVIAHIFKGIK
jgi:site-specific DNA-cytosine methylase